MKALSAILFLSFGCAPPPTNPHFAGEAGTQQVMASRGAIAELDGIGEAVDVQSTHPEVATGQYHEERISDGNDIKSYRTVRGVTVSSGMAGTTELVLLRAGSSDELARTTITVADAAHIL